MVTSCHNCPLRKLPGFDPMTRKEVEFMQKFKSGELKVGAGTTLLREGEGSAQLYTVLSGKGLRYKTLPTGQRQVLNFVFPGDFVGLQAGVMDEMQHSVESATDMILCIFDRSDLWTLFRDHPGRAFDVTWNAAVEEHFLGENLAVLGRMSGTERVALAFARLFDRAGALGLIEGDEMPMPFRQQDLADAVGLSLVHTNKTIQKLRNRKLAVWQNSRLQVTDYEGLCDVAGVDPDAQPLVRPLI